MRYALRKSVMASSPIVEIGEERKDEILAAWANVNQAAEVEEAWDGLIENFIELELATLNIALQKMVGRRGSCREYQDNRQLLARRFSNLLQSCKFYLDGAPAFLRRIAPKWEAEFSRLIAEAEANSFEFRFIYELRNHAQHRGSPFHGATYHSNKVDPQGEGADQVWQFRYAVTLWINPAAVGAETRNKKLKPELLQLSGEIDAFDALRKFLEVLGAVHWQLREAMKEARAEWAKAVRDAIADYGAANNGDARGLVVATMSDDLLVAIEEMSIFEDLIARVEELERRNGNLQNLARRHVTNRATR